MLEMLSQNSILTLHRILVKASSVEVIAQHNTCTSFAATVVLHSTIFVEDKDHHLQQKSDRLTVATDFFCHS
jgi:hypothetical protein